MKYRMTMKSDTGVDRHGRRIGLPWQMQALCYLHMLIFAVPDDWFAVIGFDYLRWLPLLPSVLVRYVMDAVFPAATTVAFMTLPFFVLANMCIFGVHMKRHFHIYLQRRLSLLREMPPSRRLFLFAAGTVAPLLFIWGGIYNRAQFALMPWFVPWENRLAAMLVLSALYTLVFVVASVGLVAEVKAWTLDY